MELIALLFHFDNLLVVGPLDILFPCYHALESALYISEHIFNISDYHNTV
jgi:hypothetical protein